MALSYLSPRGSNVLNFSNQFLFGVGEDDVIVSAASQLRVTLARRRRWLFALLPPCSSLALRPSGRPHAQLAYRIGQPLLQRADRVSRGGRVWGRAARRLGG